MNLQCARGARTAHVAIVAACAGILTGTGLARAEITVEAPADGRAVVNHPLLPVFDLTNSDSSNVGINVVLNHELEIVFLGSNGIPIQGNGSLGTTFAASSSATVTVAGPLPGSAGDLLTLTLGVTPSGGSPVSDSVNYRLIQNRVLTGTFDVNAGRHMLTESIGTLELSGGALDDDHATRITLHGDGYAGFEPDSRLQLTFWPDDDVVFNGSNQTHTLNVRAIRTGSYSVDVALPSTNLHTTGGQTTAYFGSLLSAENLPGADLDLSGVTIKATGTALEDRHLTAATVHGPRIMAADLSRTQVEVDANVAVTTVGDDSSRTRLVLNAIDKTEGGLHAVMGEAVTFNSASSDATVHVAGTLDIADRTPGIKTHSINLGSAIQNGEDALLQGQQVQASLPVEVKYHILADNEVDGRNVTVYHFTDANPVGQTFTNGYLKQKYSTDTHTNIQIRQEFTVTSASGGTVTLTSAPNGGITGEGLDGENVQSSYSFDYTLQAVQHAAVGGPSTSTKLKDGDKFTLGNAAGPDRFSAAVTLSMSGYLPYFRVGNIGGVPHPGQPPFESEILAPGQSHERTVQYLGPATTTGGFDKIYQATLRADIWDYAYNTTDAATYDDGDGWIKTVYGEGRFEQRFWTIEQIVPTSNATGVEEDFTGDFGDGGRSLTSPRLTTASLIDSLAISTPVDFSIAFDSPDNATGEGAENIASDIVRLSGLGNILHVVQVSYDPAKGTGQGLNWFYQDQDPEDGIDNPDAWINAVLGNSNITELDLVAGTLKVGEESTTIEAYLSQMRYGGSYGAYLLANELVDPELGAWGVDVDRHVVWAVIDHNSDFAAVVPEPASPTLLGLAGLGLARRRRHAA